LCGFYLFFHVWLNLLAEVLRFGDRCFYKAWWNANNFGTCGQRLSVSRISSDRMLPLERTTTLTCVRQHAARPHPPLPSHPRVEQYWRLWNIPVHNWIVRHCYFPCLRHITSNKTATGFICFTLSAVLHEVVVAVPLSSYKMPLAFLAMMAQVPPHIARGGV
jgi:diacylglycerol O-acyltransferase 1